MEYYTFQSIPQEYESMKNQIRNKFISILYSKFSFLYFSLFEKDFESCIDDIYRFLYDNFKDYKFITYQFHTNIINNQTLKDENLADQGMITTIICIEKKCLIIESNGLTLIWKVIKKLKENGSSVLNPTESDFIEEINNFCLHFKGQFDDDNIFYQYTISSIALYIIRRFFYPTSYFIDASFFIYNQPKKFKEQKIKETLMKLLLCNNIDKIIQLHKFFQDQIFSIDDINDENCLQEFQENDFIGLKTIYSNKKAMFHLVIHLDSFHVFLKKTMLETCQNEINFCNNYSHRCITKCYGFIINNNNNNNQIAYIYEFLNNDSMLYMKKSDPDKISENFSLMVLIRLCQAIEYLHSNSLIHRDIQLSNILLDHDYLPYLSDFETIRHPPNDQDTSKNEITNNIGSDLYLSPEQFTGENVSYPTDIYSYGLITFDLIEKEIDRNTRNNLNMTNKLEPFQKIFKLCYKESQKERPTISIIKKIIKDHINSLHFISQYLSNEGDKINLLQIVNFTIEYIIIQDKDSYYINQILQNLISLKLTYLANIKKFQKDFMLGYYNYESKHYDEAIRYFKSAVKHNNSNALLFLGSIYFNGQGVKKDYVKAKDYYEKASKYNSDALIHLGNLYINGYGVEKNYAKAISYFESAYKKNNQNAALYLGEIYLYGKGGPKDYPKAVYYFKKLSSQNNSYANLILGNIYFKGLIENKPNYPEAIKYYKIAANLDNSFALNNLGKMYYYGYGVETNYSEAIKYFTLASKFNNPDALTNLGNIYYFGKGVEKNLLIAKNYYELAEKFNYPDALYLLGCYYINDKFDISKSISYFSKCIEILNENCNIDSTTYNKVYTSIRNKYFNHSYNNLGLIYLIYFRDFGKAINYIKEAAFNEFPFGQNNFGLINQLYFGNNENAEYMFKKASNNHFALAEYNLGYLLEKNGKIKDSIIFYENASDDGDKPNMFHNDQYYDIGLDISKTFIICFVNLKLVNYYLSISDYKKSRKYFIKILSKLIIKEGSKPYQFRFQFNEDKTDKFSYLKSFILNYPFFNMQNYSNQKENLNNINNEEKQKTNSVNYYEFNPKSIEYFKENNYKQNQFKILYGYLKNDINNENEGYIFTEPEKLFDFIINKQIYKEDFIKSLQEILEIMSKLLYTQPYLILFGRINFPKLENKTSSNMRKNIDEHFYEGFNDL